MLEGLDGVQEDCKYLLDEGMWDGEEMRACERTRTRERDSTSLLVLWTRNSG